MSVTSSTKPLEQQDSKRSFNLAGIWDRFGMLIVFAGLFILCALLCDFHQYERAWSGDFDEWHGGMCDAVLLSLR